MTDITIIADPEHDKKAAAAAARKANLAKGRATAAANRAARKLKTRATAAPPPAAKTATSDLAGLTALACCDACRPDRCVISCSAICAHPAKGGLQANLQNEKTLRLFNEAKRIISGLRLKLSGE